MREKIENRIVIDVEGAPDLTQARELVVWIDQLVNKLTYTPTVEAEDQILVVIPYEDAMKLSDTYCARIQLVGVDGDGNPFSSDPASVEVGKLLREEGYRGLRNTT